MTDNARQDHDVRECAYGITAAGKRVLLLHGGNAADRHAFVEGRLMPFLEMPDRLFGFLRTPAGVMIRATSGLPKVLASALEGVAARTSQIGPVRRAGLADGIPAASVTGPGNAMARAFQALAKLTDASPDTIIVAVSEYPASMASDPDDPFLAFLRSVGESQIDAKVVVAVDAGAYRHLGQALATGRLGQSYTFEHEIR